MTTNVPKNAPQPSGELFSRLYVERGAPTQDSEFFRNRLEAYLVGNHFKDYADLTAYLKQEAGLIVPTSYLEKFGSIYYNYPEFFSKARIELLLSAITLIWKYLRIKHAEWQKNVKPDPPYVQKFPKADAWLAFVSRAFREENLAYVLDEACGVHFLVDEAFERNRVSALKCLEVPRYAGVRSAFEAAHSYLDAHPADTKASILSSFEALEIQARLMDPTSKNLNKWMVENKLKPLALASAGDSTEVTAIGGLFDSVALAVDALHMYRHGQGVQQRVAPSLSVAVYVASLVASTLRWLVTLDQAQQQAKAVSRV